MRFALISVLFIVSCGKPLPDFKKDQGGGREFNTTNPIFKEYIGRFENSYGSKISDIPLNLKTLPSGIAGYCIEYSSGTKEIVFDSTYWSGITDLEKEELVFHELGHCQLNKDHKDGFIDLNGNNCKSSIMNSFVFTEYEVNTCYITNHDYYIDELF